MHGLPDLREIAILEEGRQAAGVADVARQREAIAGGFMCRGEPGTWCNTAIGLGLAGPVSDTDLDRLIAWYEDAGLEPRIEVCPFAHETLLAALHARAFLLRLFENVLFRSLTEGSAFAPVHPCPGTVEIRPIPRSDLAATREYGQAVAAGFSTSGTPREQDIELMTRCARHERSTAFGAFVDGRCIGGGAIEVQGPIAGLFGASVHPDFRRQGIQQALIARRLNFAAEHGARFATIGSRPGVPTERNVRRMGFQVAYTKVALVRPRPGLVPVSE